MKSITKYIFSFIFSIIILTSNINSSLSENKSGRKIIKSNKVKNIDNKFLNSVNNLKNYMKSKQGAIFKKLDLKFITRTNRFVVAGEDIQKDSTIVSIPFMSLIHVGNPFVRNFCKNLKLNIFSEKNLDHFQFRCLVIFILINIRKPSPEFKLYIETIPKSFNEHMLFWPREDLQKLNNSFLINLINSRISEINDIFKLIGQSSLKNMNITVNEIKHAHIAVSSRNFGLYVNKKLYYTCAPYTDLFNFDPVLNTNWTMNIKNENGHFKLISTKNIPKGQQIFVNYGSDDNSMLLSGYGFTLKNNPFEKSTNNFYIKFKGKLIWNKITEFNSKFLVDILKKLKKYDSNGALQKTKIQQRIYDIKLFSLMLNSLKSYKNTNLIKKLKENLKKSPNTQNIYRILISEDKLIQANSTFLNDFIKILNGGKIGGEKMNSVVVKQNINYFKNMLD